MNISTWNFRLMRYKNGEIGLHEVYYKRNGKIRGWTEEPILTGDKKSILEQLEWIKKDIEDTKNFILPYDNANRETKKSRKRSMSR